MIELAYCEENLPQNGSVDNRTAARAIIFQKGRLLLIRTDRGDYMFPGGGVEPGENLEQAVCREVQEETGYPVASVNGLWGITHEQRKGFQKDILVMDSYYFLCEVAEAQGNLHLDGHEEKEHAQPVWVDLEKALTANQSLMGKDPWRSLPREIMVMERLLESSKS